MIELYPEIAELETNLERIRDECGSTTERTIRKIHLEIKNKISKDKIRGWNNELENSFTKLDVQKKLISKKESIFAISFIEE